MSHPKPQKQPANRLAAPLKVKVCQNCLRMHGEIKAGVIDPEGNFWFDCLCQSTMVLLKGDYLDQTIILTEGNDQC